MFSCHRIPLHSLPVSESLMAVRTLLRYKGVQNLSLTHNLHIFWDIQEPNVFYKNYRCSKLTVEMWSPIVEKVAVFALDYFEKNVASKYQKQQFVSNLWRLLRPTPDIKLNFWDHVSTVSFLQSFNIVLITRPSIVRKYL